MDRCLKSRKSYTVGLALTTLEALQVDSFYIRKKTGKITFYPFHLSKLIKQPFFGIINLTIKTIGGCFMFKVYNTQEDIARGLSDIFQEIRMKF